VAKIVYLRNAFRIFVGNLLDKWSLSRTREKNNSDNIRLILWKFPVITRGICTWLMSCLVADFDISDTALQGCAASVKWLVAANDLEARIKIIDITASSSSSIPACVFVAAGTCLPIRCLATIGEGHTPR
jgi:hypothetical protein